MELTEVNFVSSQGKLVSTKKIGGVCVILINLKEGWCNLSKLEGIFTQKINK